jgi:hypothetical protein
MPKGKKSNQADKKSASIMDRTPDQRDKQLAHAEALVAPGTLKNYQTLICPAVMRTRLKFTQRLNMTSTLGVSSAFQYSLNGLFDPYVTGVGAQPEGFDEWMAMYTAYRVVTSKLTVKSGSVGATSATGSFWMVIVPKNIVTTYTTMADAAAAPFAVSKIYQQGSPAVTWKQTMSVATIVGVPPSAILAESGYSGTASANPSGTTYWDVYIESADTTSTVTANAVVELEYVVDFYDKDNFAISLDERVKRAKRLRDAFQTHQKAKLAISKEATTR